MRRVHLKPPQSPRTALYGHFPNMTEPWGQAGTPDPPAPPNWTRCDRDEYCSTAPTRRGRRIGARSGLDVDNPTFDHRRRRGQGQRTIASEWIDIFLCSSPGSSCPRASRPERGRELATGSAQGSTVAHPGRSRPGLTKYGKSPWRWVSRRPEAFRWRPDAQPQLPM